MQNHSRRTFMKGGAKLIALGSLTTLPHSALAMFPSASRRISDTTVPEMTDPSVKALSDAALTAAQAAGAQYADVRLTHTYVREFGEGAIRVLDTESMTVGVRALVNGYWGFAASPIWTPEEAVRLARAAVDNAKTNTLGKPREIGLAPVTAITHGQWTTPIKDDPFATDEDEVWDFLKGTTRFTLKLPGVSNPKWNVRFLKQDKAFASTMNQFVTQRFYQTGGVFKFGLKSLNDPSRGKLVTIDTMTAAGLGFEYLREQPLREEIVARHAEAVREFELPLKPVDVGRYTMVFDGLSTARLVSETIGRATELDRAMGYEANAGGTSYVTDPDAMLDTLKIGAPALTVLANRTEPGGVATVKWDDEGVTPDEFAVVKDGILVDMQTSREGVEWLKAPYTRHQRPLTSHGCAYAPEAIDPPLTHCANLQMQPSATDATVETLIANIPKGLLVKQASIDMDFQCMTGLGGGATFEIKDGKRVAEIQSAGFIFRTLELWNSLIAVGGTSSLRRFGIWGAKGEPVQYSVHSVTVPPVAIKELSVIDPTRKA